MSKKYTVSVSRTDCYDVGMVVKYPGCGMFPDEEFVIYSIRPGEITYVDKWSISGAWLRLKKWISGAWLRLKKWISGAWLRLKKWISGAWLRLKKWISDRWSL